MNTASLDPKEKENPSSSASISGEISYSRSPACIGGQPFRDHLRHLRTNAIFDICVHLRTNPISGHLRKMTRRLTSTLALSAMLLPFIPTTMPAASTDTHHVIVWRETGRYGGWPANHGIWSWGDEILVGFSAGYMTPGVQIGAPRRHPIDRTRPEQHLLARSIDGGESWTIEHPDGLRPPPTTGHMAGVPTETGGSAARAFDGMADLTGRDVALTFRMGSADTGPSWFFVSSNRGRDWQGPFAFPELGLPGIAARTDYLTLGPREALVFLTSAKADRTEGRPFVARTTDGLRTFIFRSWIAPEPPKGFAIMPSTVRLDERTLVTAIRRQTPEGNGIDIYRSTDLGVSWSFTTTAVGDTGRGNPPSLVRLRDGRLALTYGYRAAPFGIRARISRDGGSTWEAERVLRDGAQDWDLGYPRSVQRSDGRIVTVYYFNDAAQPERYIAATIWDPGK